VAGLLLHPACSLLTRDLAPSSSVNSSRKRFESQMFTAPARLAMNCQTCNSRIDYRFETNCKHCGAEATAIDPPQNLVVSNEESLTWTQRLVNLAYVFASALVGLVSGGVVLYFLGAIFYLTFLSGSTGNPGRDCARGTAFAGLSILSGAFLGTVGGTTFAIKKPLCRAILKPWSNTI
jgi:hypothetical protein